jgi:hypothetical protein
MTTITCKVKFTTRNRRRCLARPNEAERQVAQARVPRISKLMALAIRFDQLLRNGTVRDISELAHLAHVTQPRMTQIMNLLHLAPDIQEDILHLASRTSGHDEVHERMLRPLAALISWSDQRRQWTRIIRRTAGSVSA